MPYQPAQNDISSTTVRVANKPQLEFIQCYRAFILIKMFSKVKLTDDQFTVIKQLSKETKLSENQIASFLVEMGISFVIAMRKGKSDEALEMMSKKMIEDETLNRLAQRLEAFWNAGA